MDMILVVDTLNVRGIMVQHSNCQLCEYNICPFANTVWIWILRWCGLQHSQFDSVSDGLDYATKWGNCPRKKNS